MHSIDWSLKKQEGAKPLHLPSMSFDTALHSADHTVDSVSIDDNSALLITHVDYTNSQCS